MTCPDFITCKWGFWILKSLDKDWDDRGENAYLMVAHNSQIHNLVQTVLDEYLEGLEDRGPSLQRICVIIRRAMTQDREYLKDSNIASLPGATIAYAFSRIIDHFLPELTNNEWCADKLLKKAIDAEPGLLDYAPAHFKNSLLTPTPAPTSNMNNIYSEIPVATPTLIYGQDIDLMDDEALIQSTTDIQRRIDKLRLIPGNSRKVARQIRQAEAALAKVVEKLDANEPAAQ